MTTESSEKAHDTDIQRDKDETKAPPFSNYWRVLSYGGRFEHIGLLLATVCAAASGVVSNSRILITDES